MCVQGRVYHAVHRHTEQAHGEYVGGDAEHRGSFAPARRSQVEACRSDADRAAIHDLDGHQE